MYFSNVLRGDWPRGVDARPPARPEEDAAIASSESRGTDAGRTESSPAVTEKIRGKRAAADEPAQKRRKTAAAAPLKWGGISLGGDQTTQPQRTMVLEWSDGDEDPVAPLLSTQTPPSSTHMEEQPRGSKEVPKHQVTEVPAGQATGVPEQ